jgi:hypothetical protein
MGTAISRAIWGPALAAAFAWQAPAFEDPQKVLDDFLPRVRAALERLPDYTCTQDVDRYRRVSPDRPWDKVDALRFEVAAVGDRELYARPGERRFQDRPLAEMVGRGTIGTGQFANLAKHVFMVPDVRYGFRRNTEYRDRPAYEFEFDVPVERSNYRLRSGTEESAVAFQGSFWVDAATLDLMRLDIQAYDMPERLGLAEANTSVGYRRVPILGRDVLLPVEASLEMVLTRGYEDLNRTRLTACHSYQVESVVRFEPGVVTEGTADRATAIAAEPNPLAIPIPHRTILEAALETELDGTAAKLGDPVTALVAREVREGEQVIVPQGTRLFGRLTRIDRQEMPFSVYEIGLEFDEMELQGERVRFSATMIDAGPASGLIRQSRRLEPTFTKNRHARMDILVREVQRGQGFLHWDARRGPVPRGFKMKWRVQQE